MKHGERGRRRAPPPASAIHLALVAVLAAGLAAPAPLPVHRAQAPSHRRPSAEHVAGRRAARLASPLDSPSIVPEPRTIGAASGRWFVWPATLRIAATTRGERAAAAVFSTFARTRGHRAEIVPGDRRPREVTFATAHRRDRELGDEGYALAVGSTGIRIAANGDAGLFYAVQTLQQITATRDDGRVASRAMTVRDWPAFRWRGIHLDVSRHFFPIATIERFIDVAAHYKLNVFHWHLTDDAAWRLEIKRRPLLTEIGACTAGGRRNCGRYSQAEVRALVAHARARHVAIVPEIDLPGHSGAALRAYPQLACDGARDASVLCPTPQASAFLDDVFTEVTQLFPAPFIHIGGDEVATDEWRSSVAVAGVMRRERFARLADVQGWFTAHVARLLARGGRRAVAWDDALAAPAPKDAAITAWRGASAPLVAARLGHDVVANPDGPLYFDAAQGDRDQEPSAPQYRSTLEQVYRFDPTPDGFTPTERSHVLGVQGDLWTERIPTPWHLFYMLLPRELALAEVAWSPRERRSWRSFEQRLPAQLAWLHARGYPFRIPDVAFAISGGRLSFTPIGESIESAAATTDAPAVRVALAAPIAATVRYTTDGSAPTSRSAAYRSAFTVRLRPGERATVKTAVFLTASDRGSVTSCVIERALHAASADGESRFASWQALVSSRRPDVYAPAQLP